MVQKFSKTIDGILIKSDDESIVEMHYPHDMEIDIELARKTDELIYESINQHSFYLLVSFENVYGQMPNEVQNFFAKEATTIPYITTAIYIINNLPIRILAKFYIRFFQPNYPTVIVTNYENGLNWIKTHKTQSVLSDNISN